MKRILSLGCLLAALISPPASAILDLNKNKMSDVWERAQNNGDLYTDMLRGDDDDGDGWTNEEEAAAGANPKSSLAPDGFIRPEVNIIHDVLLDFDENGDAESNADVATISWPIIAGKIYTLLHCTNLADGSWAVVTKNISEANGIRTCHALVTRTDGVPPTDPKMFWRLKIEDVDTDGDGLTNAEEHDLGTDPSLSETVAGYPDLWLATHFLNTLMNDGPSSFDPNGDPDCDGLSNSEENQNDTDPNNSDSDGDGLNDSEDAVPTDTEINWAKTPENRYVWIAQVDESVTEYPPLAVNKHGQILFHTGSYFGGEPSTRDKALWNSATREWISLSPAGSQEVAIEGNTITLQDPVNEFIDINDDGTVYGVSIGEQHGPADPLIPGMLIPGMLWKRTGESLTQYGPPKYFFPVYPIQSGQSVIPAAFSQLLYSRGAIANDGTVNTWGSYSGYGWWNNDWMTYDGNGAGFGMNSVRSISPNTILVLTFAGAILDKDRALFVELEDEANASRVFLKEGSGSPTDISFLADSYVLNTNICLAPSKKDNTGTDRLWLAIEGRVFLEKRAGGSGIGRWHAPPSMSEGAICLNSSGTAMTPTKLWRNGKYTDLNEVTSKPASVTITQAIDLASNGIILASAMENGVTKTGILLPVGVVPDYNRDGIINDEDSTKVTEENPLVFWINDDDDDNAEPHYGDIPGTQVDGADMVVNGARDLVDFFPVQLRLELILAVLPADKYTYRISHPTGTFHFIEMPDVHSDSSPEAQGAGAYLRNPTMADHAMARSDANLMSDTAGQGAELTAEYLNAAKDGMGVLLFEAKSSTNQSFELIISKKNGGGEVARITRAMPVEIVDVEKMFWRSNIRPAAYGQTPGAVVEPEYDKGTSKNWPNMTQNIIKIYEHFSCMLDNRLHS